jgi:hypothetical protein
MPKRPGATKSRAESQLTRSTVDRFEKLKGQFEGLYDEISLLSKKSPNDAVSRFKLGFVNQLLGDANELLGETYRPFDDFLTFDVDDVPQNSDVVLILSQYIKCLEKYRSDNVVQQMGAWYWAMRAEPPEEGDDKGLVYLRTTPPERLRV